MPGRGLVPKKVLVTGGAGFIGSELVRQLAREGCAVVAVDSLVNGRRENLEDVTEGDVRLVVADIRDTGEMASLLPGVDVIYHLACLGVRHSIHGPAENHEVNATATLGLCRAARVRRFVYVSTSEVYGTARWAPMTEEHPTYPNTVYGASKLAGECYARAYHRTYGYPTVMVRPFNTFGPRCHHEGDSGEVIPRFLLRCMAGRPMTVFGDGEQTRDFTYVGDTARGIALAGWTDAAVGQTLNLGSGGEISVSRLAREVAAACGRERAPVEHTDPRPGDVLRLCADSSRAKDLLGFEPQVSLRAGLERLLHWYRRQGRGPEELLRDEVARNWERPPGAGA